MNPKSRSGLPKELYRFGRHLVYSEGTKTEPFYVDSIKECIDPKFFKTLGSLELINCNKGKSRNTIGLARYSFEDSVLRFNAGEKIEHVWVLFDKDNFPKADFDNAIKFLDGKNDSKGVNNESFHYNNKTGITYHALYSNEAFELFLLLYFNLVTSGLSRKTYQSKINSFVKAKGKVFDFSYQKNMEHMHKRLVDAGGSLDLAVKYSKKLCSNTPGRNPSTKVYEFAEYFFEYLLPIYKH